MVGGAGRAEDSPAHRCPGARLPHCCAARPGLRNLIREQDLLHTDPPRVSQDVLHQ